MNKTLAMTIPVEAKNMAEAIEHAQSSPMPYLENLRNCANELCKMNQYHSNRKLLHFLQAVCEKYGAELVKQSLVVNLKTLAANKDFRINEGVYHWAKCCCLHDLTMSEINALKFANEVHPVVLNSFCVDYIIHI